MHIRNEYWILDISTHSTHLFLNKKCIQICKTIICEQAGNEVGAGEVLKDAVPKGDFTQSAYYQDTLSRSDISQQAVPAPESSERGHRTPDTLQQPVDSLSLSCICVLSPATPDPSRQSDKN